MKPWRSPWAPVWAPVWALWLLSAVPVAAGAWRLLGLLAGAPTGPDDARFFAAPAPVAWHVVGATVFCLVGALQLSTAFRRGHAARHRRLGWLAVPAGLAAAVSGVWMTAAYRIPEPLQGGLLLGVRWLVGLAMAACLLLGVQAARQRRWAHHRAWMLRAYALGLGAGTQVLLLLPVSLVGGAPAVMVRDLLMSAAWAVNLLLAEWLIRRPARGAWARLP